MTTIASQLLQYPTGNLCNANTAVRALDIAIKPLLSGVRLAGPAKTARIAPGQNAAIHRAVHTALPGDVLVVDGAGATTFGPFGDLLAECCKTKGIAGAVLDCSIRDSAEIRDLGFQVFSRGYQPAATAKDDPGDIDTGIVCGGVRVRPGDIIVADDDGVVVVPRDIAATVAEQVKQVVDKEASIRARILAGESTFEIFGLDRS
ncbi:MAG: RraA family protein [Gammaproteobacteria bacterium]|nr:MAG: RraA family protein [Gammaproteobacteria bacterium]